MATNNQNTPITNQPILPHDDAIENLDQFSSHLNSANSGFNNFIGQIGNLSSTIRGLDRSILNNSSSLGSGLSNLANASRLGPNQQRQNIRPNYNPTTPFMPDFGNLFPTDFQHPAMAKALQSNFRSSRPDTLGGQIGQSYTADANKNLLQLGHTLNPLSFMQYSMMYGASFPVQMKMAETITRPVTDVNQQFDTMKSFTGGFTGIGEAIKGFSSQMKSPFQMYEGLYQSKIMLSSALGGDKASNMAVTNAMKMAREYPVKTEQVLSSLSRLAVYPEVKPNLQNSDFQKKLMETVSGLSLIVPEQGMEGAMFSLVEAMSGN